VFKLDRKEDFESFSNLIEEMCKKEKLRCPP